MYQSPFLKWLRTYTYSQAGVDLSVFLVPTNLKNGPWCLQATNELNKYTYDNYFKKFKSSISNVPRVKDNNPHLHVKDRFIGFRRKVGS